MLMLSSWRPRVPPTSFAPEFVLAGVSEFTPLGSGRLREGPKVW